MDYLTEIVFQEVAFEGPGGVTLNDLWILVRKRVGPCVDDYHVRFSVWHRLRQNEGHRVTFHCKEADEWKRVVDLTQFDFKTAHSPNFAIKASVKARVHCLGMEMGFVQDQGSLQETKKHAFRTIQLIARCRQDGVQQTRLTEHFQVDTKYMSRIIKYLADRNLVDKMAATKASAKSDATRGGTLVYVKRLSDRKVWPVFYSGLNFYHGVTDVMRKANAINLVKRNGLQFIIDSMKKKNGRVTFTVVLHEMLSSLLKDSPSLTQAPQQLRELFHKQIVRFLHKCNEWCVVRRKKEGAWLELQRRADANPEEIVEEWESSTHSTGDNEDYLKAQQRTLEGEAFRPTVLPYHSLHQSMLRGVIENSPFGLPRYSMTNLSESRINERLIQEVTEKAVHGIRLFNSSLGRVQMLVTHVTRPVAAEFRRKSCHYAPYLDPTLYPKRCLQRGGLMKEDEQRCARPAGLPSGSSVNSILHQTFYLPPLRPEVTRDSFNGLLQGTRYESPFPGVGGDVACVAKMYTPSTAPMGKDERIEEDVDDKQTILDRVEHWGKVHAKACCTVQPRRGVKNPEKNASSPEGQTTEDDAALENLLDDQSQNKSSGKTNIARIQWKRDVLKLLTRTGGCALMTTLRSCISDRKLLRSVVNEMLEKKLVEEKVVEVELYIDKLSFSAICLPGFDFDTDVGRVCLQAGRSATLKRQSRPTAPSHYRPKIILETATTQLPMSSSSRYDDFDDPVFCYIFRLQALPITTFVSSELVTKDKMTTYDSSNSYIPTKTRASYDLSLARNHVKYFYMIRNGYCTARMACVRSLHSYLLQLPSRTFTVRNLILGMNLKLFAEVNGICVDIEGLLDETQQDTRTSIWEKPIQLAGKKLNDYLFSTEGSGAHGKDVVKSMISCLRCLVHLGVVSVKHYTDIPTDSVLLQAEFTTLEDLTIRRILSDDAISVISARRSIDFLVSENGPKFAEYWKALMEILLDASISTDMMNVTPLGQNVRTARGWEPVQNITAQSLRLLKTFKELNKKDKYLPSDCYSLMKAVGMHYATAVRCLLFDPLFQTSGIDLYRATGIAIRTRQLKEKLGTIQSIKARAACLRRKRQEIPSQPSESTRRARLRTEKRKLLRDDTAELHPTKRRRKNDGKRIDPNKSGSKSDDDDDDDSEAPRERERHDGKDERDDFELGEVTREDILPHWATGQKIAQMMEAVVRYGLGTERDGSPRISEHGYLTLRASAAKKVAAFLGISVAKLKSRWRYICRKKEAQKLTESVTMLREYNARSGFDLNTSLRDFFMESYEPLFQEGAALPRRYSKLVKELSLIGGRYQKHKVEEPTDTPKFRTCIELLKVINICPEEVYDNEVSAELIKPFAYVPGVQSLVLHEALNRLTKLSSKNILTHKKGSQGGRRYQLSVTAQECLVPIIFGIPTFQEALRLHKEVRDRDTFVPHPVLEGGHLAYIVDQYSAGKISLLCGDFRKDIYDPVVSGGRSRITSTGFLASFFGKNPVRGQRFRGKLYFIPQGIACVKRKSLLQEVFNDDGGTTQTSYVDGSSTAPLPTRRLGSAHEAFSEDEMVEVDAIRALQLPERDGNRTLDEPTIPSPSYFDLWKTPDLSSFNSCDEVAMINPWRSVDERPPPPSPAGTPERNPEASPPRREASEDTTADRTTAPPTESQTPASGAKAPLLSDHAARCAATRGIVHLAASGYDTYFNPDHHDEILQRAYEALELTEEGAWLENDMFGELGEGDEMDLDEEDEEERGEVVERGVGVGVGVGGGGGYTFPDHPLEVFVNQASQAFIDEKWKPPAATPIAELVGTKSTLALFLHHCEVSRYATPLMLREPISDKAIQLTSCFVNFVYGAIKFHGEAGCRERLVFQVVRKNVDDCCPGFADAEEVACVLTTVSLSLLQASKEIVVIPERDSAFSAGFGLYFTKKCGEINLFPTARLREFRAARMLTTRSHCITTLLSAALVVISLSEVTTIPKPEIEKASEEPAQDISRRLGRKRRNYNLWENDGDEDVSRPASMVLTLDGSINHAVAKSACVGILDYLMKHPGAPLATIQEAFPLFSSVLVAQMVSRLEDDAVLRTEYYSASQATAPTSLFSSRSMIPKEKVYFVIPGTLPKFPYTTAPVG